MAQKVPSIDAFNAYFRQASSHPLVAVGDLSRADYSLFDPLDFDMYCVVLMDSDFGELVKEGKALRYRAGTLFTARPGQVIAMNLDYRTRPRGWMLAFRPELLEKTGLGRDFYMFSFFNHDVKEALELSPTERATILNCYANLSSELLTRPDYLSGHMIRLCIGLLLSYCKRFFERQFAEQAREDRKLHERLETVIDNYLSSGSAAQQGQPTVTWCAGQFNLSPNYFGDLVRKELHVSAQDFIQSKIISAAQHLLDSTQMSINEIAEELGFAYPNHFIRMFKNKTGQTPLQYRRGSE